MTTKSTMIGVAVLPSPAIRDIVITMASVINGEFPLGYVHDGVQFHPHMTLFQTRVRDRAAAVEAVASSLRKLPLPYDFSILPRILGPFRGGFLFLYCDVGRGITAVHEQLARALHLHVARDEAPIAASQGIALPPAQAVYAREYGYALSFEEYRPHITIGRFKIGEPKPEDLMHIGRLVGAEERILRNGPRFSPGEIVVYDVGVDGACVAIRERFPLPR